MYISTRLYLIRLYEQNYALVLVQPLFNGSYTIFFVNCHTLPLTKELSLKENTQRWNKYTVFSEIKEFWDENEMKVIQALVGFGH